MPSDDALAALQEASFVSCDLVDSDFAGSELERASFGRCELGGADLSTATGVYPDPATNRVKDAFVPVETAVQLARAQGFRVAGFDGPRQRKARR